MTKPFGPRRSIWLTSADLTERPLSAAEADQFETFDLIYRSLCAILFNYVPTSGHPGGSISSGRFVSAVLFDSMTYDVSNPDRPDADLISYAAGHKALGLYGMWALRNEVIRIAAPEMLPGDERLQLRLEDLLGFRRNPISSTPLFRRFNSKPLDGHPTPATPFLRLSTGASGVGMASSVGLAVGAADYYGTSAPKVHIIEGEGGLTPGRVAETLAMAGTASLGNVIVHLDWNQASIDSNHVTREGDKPGDYVQWDPMEFFYLYDWNVIEVSDGFDFQQVVAAQRKALSLDNGQPTVIVYRTVKGWKYGIEGRASHGAGHKFCSAEFHDSVYPLLEKSGAKLPSCEIAISRCEGGKTKEVVEECFWQSLLVIREALETHIDATSMLARRLVASRERLDAAARKPRVEAPALENAFMLASDQTVPEELVLKPGGSTTLRAQLGKVLHYFNKASNGAFLVAAADLLGSTSVSDVAKGFREGFYNAKTNPASRTLSTGGICEDAMSGILSGVSSFGRHVGIGSSYGAFLAPLGHIAARLHAIGNQARQAIAKEPYKPFILICAHAGLKTGEDGPTHADPQPLQLLQGNFPTGTAITLTPWEPQEIWHLVAATFAKRPAVIAPFVTRPNETILDREKLGLAPASAAVSGVYQLRKAKGEADGTIVLQESGVTYEFVQRALPLLEKDGIDVDVFYVASAELFDLLSEEERARIFSEKQAMQAMGITGFTMPTMHRWIRSDFGRAMTMHPYQHGRYPGSGPGEMVIAEAGLDGESQYRTIVSYVTGLRERRAKGALAMA
jgi:transketolase